MDPLKEYEDREIIRQVQQALNDAGFNCGTPDGVTGKNTCKAITDCQAAMGLTQTGTVTAELLIALGHKDIVDTL